MRSFDLNISPETRVMQRETHEVFLLNVIRSQITSLSTAPLFLYPHHVIPLHVFSYSPRLLVTQSVSIEKQFWKKKKPWKCVIYSLLPAVFVRKCLQCDCNELPLATGSTWLDCRGRTVVVLSHASMERPLEALCTCVCVLMSNIYCMCASIKHAF